MKIIYALFIALFFFSFQSHSQEYKVMIDSGNFTVQQIIDNAEAYYANRDKGRGSGYKQFKRWEYMANRLMKENGYLPTIIENLEKLRNYESYLNSTSAERLPLNDNWEELGPKSWSATSGWNPGVGRITGIAVDKTNNDHIIVGANTGGVWKSIDAGQTWVPLNDYFTNLFVFSVAIDPADSNTYFFGSEGGLIFKSVDAGLTWIQVGSVGNSDVNKILINPSNSNMMFATSADQGIYRSMDGGDSWTEVANDSQGYDVEFKPGDLNTVYISGSKFYVSTDGGTNFIQGTGFTSGPKMIGVSPADPNVVYVLEANNGRFGAFYVSNDSGVTFTKLNHSGKNYFGYSTTAQDDSGQAPRDMDVAVSPTDANEVHIAGVLTWRSTDGGVTFNCTSDWIPDNAAAGNRGYCHADVDILEFVGNTLFVGTDGGIYKATDTQNVTANYYTDLTTGIGIRQFYKIGISQTEDVKVTGGAQDNGSSFYTAATGWKDWLGADGMEGFIDKDNPNIMYGTTQQGSLYRSTNGGNSQQGLNEPGPGSGNWVSPFEQDPILANSIYVGYNQVFKSLNYGNTWAPISQIFPSNLDELKIAQTDNNVMYASRNSFLYRTIDGGATNWVAVTRPGGLVNAIAIHPTNPLKIAIATTSSQHVFVSEDGGDTWANYKKNLPDFAATALVWDNNGEDGLYVGMNYGVFYIDNTFTDWQPYAANLPNVIINELEVNSVDHKLYAGTYGRGLWATPVAGDFLGTQNFVAENDITMVPNPANNEVTFSYKNGLESNIEVFDISGKLLLSRPKVELGNPYKLDISNLKSGTYFVRLTTTDGTVTKKLIRN